MSAVHRVQVTGDRVIIYAGRPMSQQDADELAALFAALLLEHMPKEASRADHLTVFEDRPDHEIMASKVAENDFTLDSGEQSETPPEFQIRGVEDLSFEWAIHESAKEELELREQRLIDAARMAGISWAKIGDVIGLTGPAVYRRYDPKGQRYQKEYNSTYNERYQRVKVAEQAEDTPTEH